MFSSKIFVGKSTTICSSAEMFVVPSITSMIFTSVFRIKLNIAENSVKRWDYLQVEIFQIKSYRRNFNNLGIFSIVWTTQNNFNSKISHDYMNFKRNKNDTAMLCKSLSVTICPVFCPTWSCTSRLLDKYYVCLDIARRL